MSLSKALITIGIFMGFQSNAFGWDTAPQAFYAYNHWSGEKNPGWYGTSTFNYIDDGSSQVRISTVPPTEGSTGGVVLGKTWSYLDGHVVLRGIYYKNADNSASVRPEIGGVDQMDKVGVLKGTFYMWYGKQAMATVTWDMWYAPFPKVEAPAGVIDLGECHKSVKGIVLSKAVEPRVDVYGYLNGGTYQITRTLQPGALPTGASFTEADNSTTVENGVPKVLNASIPEPYFTINDKFIAKLDCDKANVGVQTWNVKVTYSIQ